MLTKSICSSKLLAFGLALVAMAGVTGCGGSDEGDDNVVVQPAIENVNVTAADVNTLAAGQYYSADLAQSKLVYRFDYSQGAIDYTRVKLLLGSNSSAMLDAEMAALETADYGSNPKPILTQASDKRFSVSSEPADFGVLTQSELDELHAGSYLYKETRTAPSGSPQSTDNCIHAVCVICVDSSGAPYDWSDPNGAPVCVEIQHVWCD